MTDFDLYIKNEIIILIVKNISNQVTELISFFKVLVTLSNLVIVDYHIEIIIECDI